MSCAQGGEFPDWSACVESAYTYYHKWRLTEGVRAVVSAEVALKAQVLKSTATDGRCVWTELNSKANQRRTTKVLCRSDSVFPLSLSKWQLGKRTVIV